MNQPEDTGYDAAADRARLHDLLRTTGPRTAAELAGRPELAGWSTARLEKALAGAWSHGQVSVDRGDAFFAL
ncbi:hypothetical protein [Marmoricola sp. RAF53]|uniref:hypothetical protein n=1 Tax=Marmoricola sp. RAF53 TaxID=3233059 RepID=UPI003F96755A